MPVDLGNPQFWVAVLQIIAIDIVLGGDNAVVIALACCPRSGNAISASCGACSARSACASCSFSASVPARDPVSEGGRGGAPGLDRNQMLQPETGRAGKSCCR